MKKNKIFGMNEEILLATAALILLAMLMSFNVLVNPEDSSETTKREILFEIIGLSDTILIDDNPDFTSPLSIGKPFRYILEPGTYYWKAGLSETRKFTIATKIAIDAKQIGDEVKVKNVGNVPFKLSFSNGLGITGSAVLGVGESLRKKSITEVIAEQNE